MNLLFFLLMLNKYLTVAVGRIIYTKSSRKTKIVVVTVGQFGEIVQVQTTLFWDMID